MQAGGFFLGTALHSFLSGFLSKSTGPGAGLLSAHCLQERSSTGGRGRKILSSGASVSNLRPVLERIQDKNLDDKREDMGSLSSPRIHHEGGGGKGLGREDGILGHS